MPHLPASLPRAMVTIHNASIELGTVEMTYQRLYKKPVTSTESSAL